MTNRSPRRLTRRQAAKRLACTYENVRRLQRTGQLHSTKDRHGVHLFDALEVDELARRRGNAITPDGVLTARVFRMLDDGKGFREICIATEQPAETIALLCEQYAVGGVAPKAAPDPSEDDALRERDDEIAAMDRELARRRAALFSPPSSATKQKKKPSK